MTHTQNRLTFQDQRRITAAISEAVNNGHRDPEILARIAYHSVGCSEADLTESEIKNVAYVVRCHLIGK